MPAPRSAATLLAEMEARYDDVLQRLKNLEGEVESALRAERPERDRGSRHAGSDPGAA